MNDKAMNDAHDAFIKAGFAWQEASVNLLKEEIPKEFPTAKWAELTVIIDENYAEHSIMVFDDEDNELTADKDFPPDDDQHWWLIASEGAVFGEGDYTTIYFD